MKLFIKLLLLSTVLIIKPAIAISGSVSGNLVLPTPYSISEDMRITVSAVAVGAGDPNPHFVNINITAMEATGGLTKPFFIVGLMIGVNYTLQYDCKPTVSLEACQNIVIRGFSIATNQTTVRVEEATSFSGSANTLGIDLPVLTGKSITGTISLPSGAAPIGGVTYKIRAQPTVAPTGLLSLEVGSNIIAEGNSSDTFKVTIPDDATEKWTIGYRCSISNTHCNNNYIPTGYRKNGAANDTVENKGDADELDGDADSANQDMTFLEGYTISGTINVPASVIDASGLQVRIHVSDRNNPIASFNTTVTIPVGLMSTNYSLSVSLDETADWVVRYSCQTGVSPVDCSPYITQAFYDSSEATNTTTVDLNAELLVGGSSYSNIDMTMLTGRSISGKLFLSDGVAPAGGIAFTVRANDVGVNNSLFTTDVAMLENDTEVSYLINVEDDAANNYRIHFDCSETTTIICEKLSDLRYYDATTGDTIDVENDADALAGDATHTNIDLEVLSSALLDELCVPVKTSAGGVAVFCL